VLTDVETEEAPASVSEASPSAIFVRKRRFTNQLIYNGDSNSILTELGVWGWPQQQNRLSVGSRDLGGFPIKRLAINVSRGLHANNSDIHCSRRYCPGDWGLTTNIRTLLKIVAYSVILLLDIYLGKLLLGPLALPLYPRNKLVFSIIVPGNYKMPLPPLY
jgi:hypothetical protein